MIRSKPFLHISNVAHFISKTDRGSKACTWEVLQGAKEIRAFPTSLVGKPSKKHERGSLREWHRRCRVLSEGYRALLAQDIKKGSKLWGFPEKHTKLWILNGTTLLTAFQLRIKNYCWGQPFMPSNSFFLSLAKWDAFISKNYKLCTKQIMKEKIFCIALAWNLSLSLSRYLFLCQVSTCFLNKLRTKGK